MLVDVRTDQQFDDAHIPGAICIPAMRAGFGSRLAWLADRGQEIVFVGRDDDDGRRAARLAMAVGLEKLAGFLGGGYTSWLQEGREVDHIERLPAAALAERLDDGMQLLDVRERSEWDAGRIPGSVHRPWHDIDAVPEGIDPARPVAAVCGSGERSAVAASLLQHHGASGVLHVVDGGVGSWAAGGGTLES
jgi:rhodanese-related sulfurtransferase